MDGTKDCQRSSNVVAVAVVFRFYDIQLYPLEFCSVLRECFENLVAHLTIIDYCADQATPFPRDIYVCKGDVALWVPERRSPLDLKEHVGEGRIALCVVKSILLCIFLSVELPAFNTCRCRCLCGMKDECRCWLFFKALIGSNRLELGSFRANRWYSGALVVVEECSQ